MESVAQSFLPALLVSASIMAGMTAYRLRNVHDGLLSASMFLMLVRCSAHYLKFEIPVSVDRTWMPLTIATLIFCAVFLRHAEGDTICRHIKEKWQKI